MKWLILALIAVGVAVSGCIETTTTTYPATTLITGTTVTSTTTTTIPSTCTGFNYFVFQSHQFKLDGTYTIELLNGNQSISIMSMMVLNNNNKEPLTGDRQPSASQKFAITGTGYYYPGNRGESFSFRVVIGYKTPDFTDHSDTATCIGTVQ